MTDPDPIQLWVNALSGLQTNHSPELTPIQSARTVAVPAKKQTATPARRSQLEARARVSAALEVRDKCSLIPLVGCKVSVRKDGLDRPQGNADPRCDQPGSQGICYCRYRRSHRGRSFKTSVG